LALEGFMIVLGVVVAYYVVRRGRDLLMVDDETDHSGLYIDLCDALYHFRLVFPTAIPTTDYSR
jgi:hypothetical protein